MIRFLWLLIFTFAASTPSWAQGAAPLSADTLVQKIQTDVLLPKPPTVPEGVADHSIPHGESLSGSVSSSAVYPGAENNFTVYVPAQYDPAKPASLLLRLDGIGDYECRVLDHLIASKEIPVMIAIGIPSSAVYSSPKSDPKRKAVRFDRSYEFDSTNDHFPDYIVNEVLPAAQKLKTKDGRAIVISPNAGDHMAMGASSGGIGAFTLAWRRPDVFGRVYSCIGTFISMRGGHEYPYLIRKTDPKPLRIFLEDGETDAWNPLLGSWYEANLLMNSALVFSGYDVAHAWGKHGHNGSYGSAILPDVMRWMWRDYPAPIKAGISQNNMLSAITIPGDDWQALDATFQSARGLAANAKGDVFLCDGSSSYQIGDDGKATSFATEKSRIAAQALGSDGTIYWLEPDAKQVVARAPDGTRRVVAEGIAGHGLTVTHDGAIYVSEPGEHSDMPSQLWKIKADGTKSLIDQGLSSASGVAFSPDGQLFYAAEASTKWVYTFIVQPDGTFVDKQPFFWLHMTDIPNNSGAEDMCCDNQGSLYIATRMGIQVADQNGRVRAILPLPTPTGAARSLCFGGPKFDVLYATDGVHVFKRQMKVVGIPLWSPPVTVHSIGAG
jgi:enterochelin esterase-like enzyme